MIAKKTKKLFEKEDDIHWKLFSVTRIFLKSLDEENVAISRRHSNEILAPFIAPFTAPIIAPFLKKSKDNRQFFYCKYAIAISCVKIEL